MEKYSKWRDPATGIQPFLPPQPPSSPPIISLLLAPLCALNVAARGLLLAAIALIHVVLVDGVCLIFTLAPPIHRLVSGALTAVTCRLALGVMGFYWIRAEMTSPKRGSQGIAQTIRQPQRGDLILSNWSSYVDVLYLAYRYNPIFLLPVFSSLPSLPSAPSSAPTTQAQSLTGRHTGTGSAQISLAATPVPQPDCLGYQVVPLLALLARTGALPPTYAALPTSTGGKAGLGFYKTLSEARKRESRPVCLLPEGTTSNGRAVLKLPEGSLEEGDFGRKGEDGIVWIKFIRHSAPSPTEPSSTSPLPGPLSHLLSSLLYTPPTASRALTVRTLHPSNSPSSPSFLPGEVLANAPGTSSSLSAASGGAGGLEGVKKDSVWREAIATVMAETGRSRRVRGMGWVEKGQFLEYFESGSGKGGKKRR